MITVGRLKEILKHIDNDAIFVLTDAYSDACFTVEEENFKEIEVLVEKHGDDVMLYEDELFSGYHIHKAFTIETDV